MAAINAPEAYNERPLPRLGSDLTSSPSPASEALSLRITTKTMQKYACSPQFEAKVPTGGAMVGLARALHRADASRKREQVPTGLDRADQLINTSVARAWVGANCAIRPSRAASSSRLGRLAPLLLVLGILHTAAAACPDFCNGNGNCVTANGGAVCSCFSGYTGPSCADRETIAVVARRQCPICTVYVVIPVIRRAFLVNGKATQPVGSGSECPSSKIPILLREICPQEYVTAASRGWPRGQPMLRIRSPKNAPAPALVTAQLGCATATLDSRVVPARNVSTRVCRSLSAY